MLRELNYRWKLRRLNRQMREVQSRVRRRRRDAKKKGEPWDDETDADGERLERMYLEEEARILSSWHLIHQANEYGVPHPSYGDEVAWEHTSSMGHQVLTIKSIADLRAAVRKEQNERWQFWELRVRVISLLLTGLTGAVGALIGLIAILK